DDERSRDLRVKYEAHVSRLFTLSEEEPADAAAHARAAIALETALAKASLDRVKRREPANTQHRMTLAAFQATMPRFDWRKYTGAVGAPKFQVLNVATPDFFRAMNDLIDTSAVDDVRAYLRWQVLHAAAPMLPKAFADADFDFFSRTLAGQQAPEPR